MKKKLGLLKKKHICPVCGFDGLKEAAFGPNDAPSYEICLSCGFEPGYDGGNDPQVFKEFRDKWVKKGRKKSI